MIPIIELRGAIPLGCVLGLPFWQSFGIAVIGNLLPAPFILLFIQKLFSWMKRFKLTRKMALWGERRAEVKSEKRENLSFFGLALFVAIPLPGTGAWTGSLVANFLGIRFRKAMLAVVVGVITAGIVVTLISYGVAGIF
ncbi:MAG: small multi-drug export protein [Clostridia bacterium]|nr:small multi-drug export protein [Clostridia bacterium]